MNTEKKYYFDLDDALGKLGILEFTDVVHGVQPASVMFPNGAHIINYNWKLSDNRIFIIIFYPELRYVKFGLDKGSGTARCAGTLINYNPNAFEEKFRSILENLKISLDEFCGGLLIKEPAS